MGGQGHGGAYTHPVDPHDEAEERSLTLVTGQEAMVSVCIGMMVRLHIGASKESLQLSGDIGILFR